jgi:hypothetical protein
MSTVRCANILHIAMETMHGHIMAIITEEEAQRIYSLLSRELTQEEKDNALSE